MAAVRNGLRTAQRTARQTASSSGGLPPLPSLGIGAGSPSLSAALLGARRAFPPLVANQIKQARNGAGVLIALEVLCFLNMKKKSFS